MSTIVDKALKAEYKNGMINITFESGGLFSFPIKGNSRLEGKPVSELNNIDISPFGLHWPTLNEDLSFKGIFSGDFGHK